MDKEQFVINDFKNPFLGDDAAVVKDQVFSKDLFFEGTHFKREWMSLDEIGYKAMVVNFSDTIAMNAKPKFVLLGLGLPSSIKSSEILELNGGIKRACDEFGAKIIGGDTIKSDKIFISVSVIGELCSKPLLRSAVKNGDLIAYTGKLGSSLKTLNALLRTPKNGFRAGRKSRFFTPILRDKFLYKSAKFLNSAMDISDGLEQDLPKLCKSAKISYKFLKKPLKYELRSGEEYEVLFSFAPKNLAVIRKMAAKCRTKVKIIAKAVKGRCRNNVRKHHF
ncbi:thiamine-phosphate kinase [Campylobacter suis]|uniref:Thiamine-monophosphate kinase n=1 Tax=Campylobacter suis TaxID=2790657 RepID=A0ABN7K504_9BACT|nr:thiamine-phosphate kinase [Campylobacter suis]CAD7287175.1 Thiamine-monophosphate kinase [Campylobacter suis]